VAVRHKKIVGTNHRSSGGIVRPVHRHVLAKYISAPNNHSGRRSFVFQILGRFADNTTGKKLIPAANHRLAGHVNVRADDAFGANRYAFIYDGVRSDLHGCMKLRLGMDNGGRMNHE
jgi:hypothetical protein